MASLCLQEGLHAFEEVLGQLVVVVKLDDGSSHELYGWPVHFSSAFDLHPHLHVFVRFAELFQLF